MIPRTLLALAFAALAFMGTLSACTTHKRMEVVKNEGTAVRDAKLEAYKLGTWKEIEAVEWSTATITEWRIRP